VIRNRWRAIGAFAITAGRRDHVQEKFMVIRGCDTPDRLVTPAVAEPREFDHTWCAASLQEVVWTTPQVGTV
jgi:hypothetical protein